MLGAAGALAAAVGYAALTGHAWAVGAPIHNCTCFGTFLPQRLTPFVRAQDASMLLFACSQLRAVLRWGRPRPGGRDPAGFRRPDEARLWWRSLRVALGRPPPSSSPARQQANAGRPGPRV